ncbi:hypothetical protein DL96DRAFT_272419 [Flagelloscypha sp. PMI_526]|nr:hypothetical protein DL96DRAFT_272419 [Flagelloscypha sp. PMI_526]
MSTALLLLVPSAGFYANFKSGYIFITCGLGPVSSSSCIFHLWKGIKALKNWRLFVPWFSSLCLSVFPWRTVVAALGVMQLTRYQVLMFEDFQGSESTSRTRFSKTRN